MQKKSLSILNELLDRIRKSEARNIGREVRMTEFLHDPESADSDWFMYVDSRFNAALSLVETKRMTIDGASSVWTQGSNFSVTKGDIFYDSAKAYEPWNVANVKRCFVVTFAIPVTPGKSNKDKNENPLPVTRRLPGHVEFDILEPDKKKSALVKKNHKVMSQDEFIRVLISGFEEQLSLV